MKRVVSAIDSRFLRFLIAGVFNTALGYGLYLLLLRLGLGYAPAWAVALAASLVVGFLVGKSVVFKNVPPLRFVYYVAGWGAIYGANIWLIGVLIGWGVDTRLAPALLLPLNITASYLVQKTAVFR